MSSRVVALLQLPAHAAHARLFAKLHAEMERRGRDAKTLSLKALTPEEHLALANLIGAPSVRTTPLKINVGSLSRALQKSALACSFFELLDTLHGGLRDRPAERTAQLQAEAELWAEARQRLSAHPNSVLLSWLDAIRQRGLLKRAELPVEHLLTHVLPVLWALPANAIHLSVLAAQAVGDAHALDRGQPLAHIILSAAAAITGTAAIPSSAGQRRRLWAEVGVICDLLSCDVLTYNLRPIPTSRLARHLNECAETGEPTRVTLRELMLHPLTWTTPDVFICENPCVPALAADHLGPQSQGLICTEGLPTTAVLHILGGLCGAGVRLHYHGDFDWGGLRIGNHLLKTLHVRPWRFNTASYQRHLTSDVPRRALKGRPTSAAWDPLLREVMYANGSAVFEEQVAQELLEDLA